MEPKYDFVGNELFEGDNVIFMQVNYRNFIKGKIIKLSPKKATIEYNFDRRIEKAIQFYDQIIKI